MNMARLKKKIIEEIKNDPDLFALVAKTMKIRPASLNQTLERNGNTLNQYSVVKVIAEFLKKNPKDVMEESKERIS